MIEVRERQRDQFPRLARTGWIRWMSSSSSSWPIVRGQKGCRSGVRWRFQTPPRDPGHRDARFGELTSTPHKNVTTAEKELVVSPEDG